MKAIKIGQENTVPPDDGIVLTDEVPTWFEEVAERLDAPDIASNCSPKRITPLF